MNFTNMITEGLNRHGEYTLGDVTFKLEKQGVGLKCIKKENLPAELLVGLRNEDLRKANPPKINIKNIVDKTIEVREDNKKYFSLYCKGDLESSLNSLKNCCYNIQAIYDKSASHITRMFGSYILISKKEDKLRAIYSTPSPIKYCPLMYKLLREIGGDVADKLLLALKSNNIDKYQKLMLDLINDVVIAGGGFDDNRPLNSCERNVTFGASEIMSDAMKEGKIEASVIVSNNLGTVITNSENTTQGVVKRMSGLFYTTPSPELVNQAFEEGIIPVFPYTSKINQVEGVKQAIKMNYKKISVSVAANDNYFLKQIADLEKDGIEIYRFALCATGVDDKTAEIMSNNADIVWSCASKPVREIIAPRALAQIGIKIPVYIMNERAWELIKPRIKAIDASFDIENIKLARGNNMPIIYNEKGGLKSIPLKKLNTQCIDCPNPCV